MKLRSFKIKGFKSIEEIVFKNLGEFNILVGENNTGKSNILDAIQFVVSNIWPLNESMSTQYPDELWPRARRVGDIECVADFEFPIGDLMSTPNLDLSRTLRLLGYGPGTPSDSSTFVRIHRTMHGADQAWRTEDILLNRLHYFSSGALDHSTFSDDTTMLTIDAAVMSIIRSCLKRIDTVRGSVARGAVAERIGYKGARPALVPQETLGEIVRMSSAWTDSSQKRIEQVNRLFGILTSGCQVSARGNTVVISDGGLESPVHTVGGGIQEMLQLAFDLTEQCDILLIEEPEAHLHPRLAQKLFMELKQMSESRQLFISTHSTTFLDQANLSDVWLVTRGEHGTKCERILRDGRLQRIADELGLLPSDACMDNALLFVEGPSDMIVLSKWFELLGFPLVRPRVNLRSMEGKDREKHRATTWKRIAEALPKQGLGLFFDSDLSDDDKADVERAIGPKNRVWRLDDGTIEDHYNLSLLKSVIVSEVEMSDAQKKSVSNLRAGRIASQVDEILGKKESWKVPVASQIAAKCKSENDVPKEIVNLLKEVIEFLREKSQV